MKELLSKDFRAKDILLAMYREHADQARQHENQRERMTAVIVALTSAILSLMSLKQPGGEIQPLLCIALIFLGLFGAAFSRKHYERNRMHTAILAEYRRELESHYPESALTLLRARAERAHDSKYFFFSNIPLNWFWLTVPLFASAIGAILLLKKCYCLSFSVCFA